MSSIFLVIQFILAFVICVSVLLQKSSSMGLGSYSGSNESLFGAKGPAGFLAKFTFVVGLLFILNTLMLGYSYNKESKKSILDHVDIKNLTSPKELNLPGVPKAPAIPKASDALKALEISPLPKKQENNTSSLK